MAPVLGSPAAGATSPSPPKPVGETGRVSTPTAVNEELRGAVVLGRDGDPTAVMGRRIGAYLVDALVPLLVALLAVLAFTDINERPELASCRGVSDLCVEVDDRVYTAGWAPVWLFSAIPLAYGVLFAVIGQGLTGATPGKAVFGLRVVGPTGGRPGIGKALVRWLLLVVDGIGCGVPLVGLITAFVSRGHRRVGDMVARTFVVDRHDAGRAIVLAGHETTSTPPSPLGPMAAGRPEPGTAPDGPPGPTAPIPAPEPQWDAEREAYVLWDPLHRRWLVHDPARGGWRPL